MDALGMNEVMSIPTGFLVCDTMLKAAEVTLVSSGCVCAGKHYTVVSGEVAAVRAAVEAGREAASGVLVDSLVIANIEKSVAPAIMACTDTEHLKSVGVMETYSLCAAIHAADAAAKAADIRLLEVRLGRGLGGKSFVLLTGDVAAVTAAVEAAETLEETQGLMGKSAVIPAPHPDLLRSMQ